MVCPSASQSPDFRSIVPNQNTNTSAFSCELLPKYFMSSNTHSDHASDTAIASDQFFCVHHLDLLWQIGQNSRRSVVSGRSVNLATVMVHR
jgi:hypothetical protein